jgi:hypothetical protein
VVLSEVRRPFVETCFALDLFLTSQKRLISRVLLLWDRLATRGRSAKHKQLSKASNRGAITPADSLLKSKGDNHERKRECARQWFKSAVVP